MWDAVRDRNPVLWERCPAENPLIFNGLRVLWDCGTFFPDTHPHLEWDTPYRQKHRGGAALYEKCMFLSHSPTSPTGEKNLLIFNGLRCGTRKTGCPTCPTEKGAFDNG